MNAGLSPTGLSATYGLMEVTFVQCLTEGK
jgi:hypothetical protein